MLVLHASSYVYNAKQQYMSNQLFIVIRLADLPTGLAAANLLYTFTVAMSVSSTHCQYASGSECTPCRTLIAAWHTVRVTW